MEWYDGQKSVSEEVILFVGYLIVRTVLCGLAVCVCIILINFAWHQAGTTPKPDIPLYQWFVWYCMIYLPPVVLPYIFAKFDNVFVLELGWIPRRGHISPHINFAWYLATFWGAILWLHQESDMDIISEKIFYAMCVWVAVTAIFQHVLEDKISSYERLD